ncbi:MAG: hypothetical protein H7062_20475, partial [Candidatus Saccharimonas sp.]|nr:hypothetical protein [Planctomycetaceae bacterium]
GPIRMNRRGWPSFGQLVATSEGLLFLPDFIARPNGAIEPRSEEPESAGRWTAPLSPSWWWPLSSRVASTRPVTFSGTDSAMPPPPFQRLLDAPGGLFVQRTSVRRLVAFWNHLHIERRPARRVTLHSVPRGVGVGELLRQLRELSAWRGV